MDPDAPVTGVRRLVLATPMAVLLTCSVWIRFTDVLRSLPGALAIAGLAVLALVVIVVEVRSRSPRRRAPRPGVRSWSEVPQPQRRRWWWVLTLSAALVVLAVVPLVVMGLSRSGAASDPGRWGVPAALVALALAMPLLLRWALTHPSASLVRGERAQARRRPARRWAPVIAVVVTFAVAGAGFELIAPSLVLATAYAFAVCLLGCLALLAVDARLARPSGGPGDRRTPAP